MGRHDRKHGAKHKAAVVHAVEQQGMTAAQVAALAAAGELKAPGLRDRLPAFSIAESTVRNYCQQARRRQRRNGHDHREHEVALAVRDSAAPSVAEIEAPPEASPLLQRLAVEMEEDRKATEAAIAERPGEQCRCELLEPSASNFLTAVKPSPWVLHNGAPTCEACRLPITDWRTRLAGYPVLIKRIEDARAAEAVQRAQTPPNNPQTTWTSNPAAAGARGLMHTRSSGVQARSSNAKPPTIGHCSHCPYTERGDPHTRDSQLRQPTQEPGASVYACAGNQTADDAQRERQTAGPGSESRTRRELAGGQPASARRRGADQSGSLVQTRPHPGRSDAQGRVSHSAPALRLMD